MPSLFTTQTSAEKPLLTHELLEKYSALAEKTPNSSAQEVMTSALVGCGESLPIRQEVVDRLLMEAHEYAKASASKSKGNPSQGGGGKRTFGSEYLRWANELKVDELLLIILEYRYAEACEYYCRTHVTVVDKVVELGLKSRWLNTLSHLEASVIGGGGELGNSKADDSAFDLENASASQEDSIARTLKAMRF